MELKELNEVWYTKKELIEKGMSNSPGRVKNEICSPRNSRRNNKDMYVSRKK